MVQKATVRDYTDYTDEDISLREQVILARETETIVRIVPLLV